MTEHEERARPTDGAAPVVGGAAAGRLRGVDAVRAAVKRAIDVAVAAVALVVLSPVFLTVALLVVLDSPGPVLYRAERVGFRGRPLAMLKFRKMHKAARGAGLTVAGDERLTRVGAPRLHFERVRPKWRAAGPRPLGG